MNEGSVPRMVDVIEAGVVRPDDIALALLGEDGRAYPLRLPRDAAVKLIAALRQAASKLPPAPTSRESAVVYQVVRCEEAVTTDRQFGLVLTTAEGLEIGIRLDQAMVNALASYIQRASNGIQ